MNVWKLSQAGCICALALVAAANGQPRITNLGQGTNPVGVNNASRVLANTGCGPKTFDIGAGVTLNSVTPANGITSSNALSADGLKGSGSVLFTGTLAGVTTTGNFVAGSWDATTNTWTQFPGLPNMPAYNLKGTGTSSSGNGSDMAQVRGMSANGRYICVQSYAYAINPVANPNGWVSTGTTFNYLAGLWDTQTNTVKYLPTSPHQVNPNRWKDGRPLCVSDDGSVVMGGENANSSGGNIIVWYKQGNGEYLAEAAGQLPLGSGDASRSVDSFYMSSDGLVIVGTSNDNTDINGAAFSPAATHTFLAKWTRPDAASRTWIRTKLYDYSDVMNSATAPGGVAGSLSSWWIPYLCPPGNVVPGMSFTITGISDDASTITGFMAYSTCGGFVRGGWIWKAGAGPNTGMMDLYDYLAAIGTIDIDKWGVPSQYTLSQHTGTLLSFATAISRDGQTLVGYGGPQSLFGPAYIVNLAGGTAKAPFTVCEPSNVTNFSRCSTPALQFSHVAGGSGTLSSQWYMGTPGSGTVLNNGTQPSPIAFGIGSDVTNASSSILRINYPNLSDVGSYYCTVTSSAGGSLDSATVTATAQFASAVTADICDVLNPTPILLCPSGAIADAANEVTYDACAAYIDEFRTGNTTCYAGTSTADVWFKYVPTESRDIRIENCNSTYFSSVISVYDNCPANGGFEVATGCSTTNISLPACSKARIGRLAVTAGQPIWIRVANQGAPSAGSQIGKIKIYPAPAFPSNDGCAAATVAVAGSNAFDTTEASYSANEIMNGVVSCSTALSRDVWFQYTPALRGTLTASTCYNAATPGTPLTTPDTMLTAFSACGGTEINVAGVAACNNTAAKKDCTGVATDTGNVTNTSFINIGQVQAGQTTWIRVGGGSATATSAIGPGTLTIKFVATPCNKADVAGLGGSPGADNQVTVDDIVFYLAAFFANTVPIADLVSLGGNPTPDAQVTVDDLVYFLAQFFSPCNP